MNSSYGTSAHVVATVCLNTRASVFQGSIMRLASEHGDAHSVRYLLHEAQVPILTNVLDENPALAAAYSGHSSVLKILLDAIPGVQEKSELLNLLLSACCQRGHVDSARLLVMDYGADARAVCAGQSDSFPVICALPLYAAAQAGSEELADFLLDNGAALSSYMLLDHPDLSGRLLARRLQRSTQDGQQALSVRWGGLSLPWLELSWLLDVSCLITYLDLSRNHLSSLPSILPWGLLRLQTLDLSHNRLTQLPPVAGSHEVICTRLREVNVHQNRLSTLPVGLLHLTELKKLCASKNQLSTLFDILPATNWLGLRKLEDLDLSDNALSALPADVMQALKSLRLLDMSRNQLAGFPEPWACPLNRCRASSNKISKLPDNIFTFWKNHLQDVDLSENLLQHLPSSLFQLEALLWLRLSGNIIRTLPPPSDWTCSQLRTLDLSRNLLGKSYQDVKSSKLAFLTTWSKKDPDPAACPVEFPALLRDSLEVLYLNDNRLDCVPPSLCALSSLSELYLANNASIRELPSALGGLSNLWHLDIENLNISNVPQQVKGEGAVSVLGFLRAQLREAKPCSLLKMLLIGPPRHGKSSLLHVLQTGKAPAAAFTPLQFGGVSTSSWEMDAAGKNNKLEFKVWDVGGPSGMSAVTPCFFTDSALYVLTWNLTLGEEAVAELRTWLLNIEARAPNSAVVVAGTHLDLIEAKFRTERLATLRAYILSLCRSPSGARARGYPDVTVAHLCEVSCKTLEGMDDLKKLIRQVVLSMKDTCEVPACGGKLMGRMIPSSYGRLREAAEAERLRRQAEEEVQFLTEVELERMVERDVGSDIVHYDDLPAAIRFLVETGTLLHFPDSSRGLHTLYFLCPVWLAECLQRIVSLESSRCPAANGIIRARDLQMLLIGTGFTSRTEEQYFQFLAKFEIALPVANDSYLLPHLLPAKPGVDLHRFQHPRADTLQRLFRMSFVPAGFWERFIARMLISLSEMDQQTLVAKHGTRCNRTAAPVFYRFGGSQQRNRCSTFRVHRHQTVYWREGLLVIFDGGYLSVESTDVNWKKKKSGGIKIVCQSESRDFSAMAFITDHINALIEQWFPALTASESDGSLVLERYAPCPLCVALSEMDPGSDHDDDGGGDVHLFNVEDCALAAAEAERITCPRHPERVVPLQELVPEVFMTDFPARLFLEKEHLEYSEDESDIIGQGGSGTVVYRARYRDWPVAIKRFGIKGNCPPDAVDTLMKHLRSAAACRRFSEFRQEAAVLHALRHPCVVALLGVSIHPLCLALELAPLGSLDGVLKERHRKGGGYAPLGHMVTYKMAYQVAAGLSYLHRKNIIFCDLKSDNILVWSLQERAAVNMKLSDYGICRQSFREGAVGVEGTPGYQAPEVRPGVVYDEKVDVFSYGMVLFELLSGRRPYAGRHRLLVSKRIRRGVRPQLAASPQEVNFHFLQHLMTQCWDAKPEKRPTALQCVWRMMDPSFACLRYVLACECAAPLFLPPVGGRHLLLWDGDGEHRSYSVVNVDKGQLEVDAKSYPGARVSCQLQVNDTLWLATHEQEVLLYVLKDACTLARPEARVSCSAVVTCFLAMPKGGVLAGMSDGLLTWYEADRAGLAAEGRAYMCSRTFNKTAFGLMDDDPRQRPAPITCMLLVAGASQLWLSNGPGVLVVNGASLSPLRRLDPYCCPSSVVSMATGSAVRGEESVWTLDDVTNTLVLFHAASFTPCARYNCGDCNPLRDVFPVLYPSPSGANARAGPAQSEEESAKLPHAAMTVACSEEAGTQIIRHRDSPATGSGSPSEDAQDGPASPSREWQEAQDPSSDSDKNLDGDLAKASPPACLLAFRVMMVNDLLWVFRRGGDVLLIQVEPHGQKMRGRVSAVLSPPSGHSLGTALEAGRAGVDAVACGFRGAPPSSTLSVCVWQAWDAARLDLFYRGAENLARLESGVRRRR